MWLQSVKKLSITFFVSILCISSAPLVLAEGDVDQWDKGETNDPKKVWTIEFNQPLKSSKVRTTSVYVMDESNRKFSTTVSLSSDKKSIMVTPRRDYEAGKEYKLYIDNSIGSETDKTLEKPIVFPFTILEKVEPPKEENGSIVKEEPAAGGSNLENSNLVKNVNINLTPYAALVSLSTDYSIARVMAGTAEMFYEGNNQFSAGIVGLEVGDPIRIRAFDAEGITVYDKEYTVH
ncbi:Ig-like domain-containing protein [Bacillus benzoevorans]|nr:Ig-like domain-containing protein [Bacillus benzoevorans]